MGRANVGKTSILNLFIAKKFHVRMSGARARHISALARLHRAHRHTPDTQGTVSPVQGTTLGANYYLAEAMTMPPPLDGPSGQRTKVTRERRTPAVGQGVRSAHLPLRRQPKVFVTARPFPGLIDEVRRSRMFHRLSAAARMLPDRRCLLPGRGSALGPQQERLHHGHARLRLQVGPGAAVPSPAAPAGG